MYKSEGLYCSKVLLLCIWPDEAASARYLPARHGKPHALRESVGGSEAEKGIKGRLQLTGCTGAN